MTTPPPPSDAGRRPVAGRAGRDARILVAEDDNTFRHVLEMLLGEHWSVEAFPDGRKVLDAARRECPDLVLADLLMAGLDGFGLVRELRSDAATRAVPVIVITGLTEEEARIKALEAGANDFLIKPFSNRELLLRVSTHLEMAALRREGAEREKEAHTRAILEGALEAVVAMDARGRITFWNPQAERIFGRAREEAMGRTFIDLVLPPGLRDEHTREMRRFLETGEARALNRRVEVSALRHDGTTFPAELAVTPMRVGGAYAFTAFIRDISDRKWAERRLGVQHEATRALAESPTRDDAAVTVLRTICEGLDWDLGLAWVVDPQQDRLRCIALWRPPTDAAALDEADGARTLGRAEELAGCVWETGKPEWLADLVSEKDGARFTWPAQAGFRAALAFPVLLGGHVLGVMEFFNRQVRQPEDDVLQMMDAIGAQVGQFYERKRAEDEVRAAYEEARAANRAKDEFLATLSHELRTPLSAIVGWTHMLRTGQLDPTTAARAIETIDRNARVQTQLISDILDVSRIVSGKLHLDVRPLELAATIAAALDTVRPSADAKGVTLLSTLEPTAMPVSADPDRLQQVVWNLLANAIKFTPRGGRVELRLRRANSHAEIVVEDTGPGIPRAFLPHVFERFRQADGSSTRAHGGLGLGLAIVRHLVEAHGGTVRAANATEGAGSVFTVRLPIMGHEPPLLATPPETALETLARSSDLEGLRILVVDDDLDTREMVSAILRGQGAQVEVAGSAADALAALPTPGRTSWSATSRCPARTATSSSARCGNSPPTSAARSRPPPSPPTLDPRTACAPSWPATRSTCPSPCSPPSWWRWWPAWRGGPARGRDGARVRRRRPPPHPGMPPSTSCWRRRSWPPWASRSCAPSISPRSPRRTPPS
jgi:PAS domain S-box-containing protein